MGIQQQMMNVMMGRKSPEDTRKMMSEMMPLMMAKFGPEGMAELMGSMMPQMMRSMGHAQMENMMLDMMPRMMDTCFSEMDSERREFMLTHCRSMLDQMEERYLKTPVG